jgi:hypothetical protein
MTVGPQIGFIFPKLFEVYQGYLNLKAYKDLETENRPSGWSMGHLLDRSTGAGTAGLQADRTQILKPDGCPGRAGTRPRFLAQPCLHLAEPCRLERTDGDYSPVEVAIRIALGRCVMQAMCSLMLSWRAFARHDSATGKTESQSRG